MDSGNESDDETISMEMLEDICEGSKSCLIVNRRDARSKIHNIIKRSKTEWKRAVLSTQNM